MTTRSSFARTDSGRSRRQKREKTKVKKSSIFPQKREAEISQVYEPLHSRPQRGGEFDRIAGAIWQVREKPSDKTINCLLLSLFPDKTIN
jgi:hypothetical protein